MALMGPTHRSSGPANGGSVGLLYKRERAPFAGRSPQTLGIQKIAEHYEGNIVSSGQYYVAGGYIHGPKESGQFYIQDGYIFGPKNSGQYYISDGYIYGPKTNGQFYISENYIYGPPNEEPPWLKD